MAWVTIGLRKHALKARINSLEYRLMKLSQDKQSQHNAAAMTQSQLSMRKNDEYLRLQNNHSNYMQGVTNQMQQAQDQANKAGQPLDGASMQQMQNKIAMGNQNFQMSQMMTDSLFQAQEDGLMQENNRKETAIDLEIERLEVQLKAARAEEEQLGKALDEDIKKTAINLM